MHESHHTLRLLRECCRSLADVSEAYDRVAMHGNQHVGSSAILQAMTDLCATIRETLEKLRQ